MSEKQPLTRDAVLTLISKRKRMAEKRRDSALDVLKRAKEYDVTRDAIKVAVESTVARELETLLDIIDKDFLAPPVLPPLER